MKRSDGCRSHESRRRAIRNSQEENGLISQGPWRQSKAKVHDRNDDVRDVGLETLWKQCLTQRECPTEDSAGMDSKEQYLIYTQHLERDRTLRSEWMTTHSAWKRNEERCQQQAWRGPTASKKEQPEPQGTRWDEYRSVFSQSYISNHATISPEQRG